MNTTKRGDISTVKILARLAGLGYFVLVPFGSARYDLAVDTGDRILRIQCKTGRYVRGCVVFNTVSNLYGGRGIGYTGDADLFAVYCPDTDAVYMVPVGKASKSHMQLRIDAARKPHSRINWARDYELLQQIHDGPVV